MRVLLVVRLALGLVLASTPALAQDADALRRELGWDVAHRIRRPGAPA